MDYEMKIVPKYDVEGKLYWTASFPAFDGCVGGGDTVEEAVKEAQENLSIYMDYLREEGINIPKGYEENTYNGKIALRISKSTHKKVAELAETEGISINLLLNNAIECFVGKKEYDMQFSQKIDKLQEVISMQRILPKYVFEKKWTEDPIREVELCVKN